MHVSDTKKVADALLARMAQGNEELAPLARAYSELMLAHTTLTEKSPSYTCLDSDKAVYSVLTGRGHSCASDAAKKILIDEFASRCFVVGKK